MFRILPQGQIDGFWGRRCFRSEDHLKTAVLTVFAVRTILKSLSFVETKPGMEFTPSTSFRRKKASSGHGAGPGAVASAVTTPILLLLILLPCCSLAAGSV